MEPATPVPVRRLVDQAKAAMIAIGAVGLSDVANLLAAMWYSSHLQTFPREMLVDEMEFDWPTAASAFAALGNLAVLMIAAFCFFLWFKRAYTNVEVFSVAPRTYGVSWTIWGFIVPILSLYRPYAIMDEIRDRAEFAWEEKPEWVQGLERPVSRVKLWWGLYLAGNIVGHISTRLSWNATTAEETVSAISVQVAATLLDLAAVAPAILVVKNITALQVPILTRALAPAGPPSPPPLSQGFLPNG